MSTRSPRVLIIGGGIGGLALAQALVASGMRVEVYERNPEADDWLRGYRIHINQYGSHALHRCLPAPLWEALVATAGRPGLGIAFHTQRLRELLFVGEELMTGGAAGPAGGQYAVSRVALRKLLLAGLGDVVRFGRTFERYELGAGGTVTAYFAEGGSATGDLLVGADGANSRVRGRFLPHARRVETGVAAVSGRLPLTAETRSWLPFRIQNGLNVVLPPAGSFMFSAVFDGGKRTEEAVGAGLDLADYGLDGTALGDEVHDYVLWSYCARRRSFPAEAGTLDGAGLRDLVGELIRTWSPDLRRMVADSDPASLRFLPLKTATPVDPWPTGRVTLLGDAIHNMTPVMGLGANTALRDSALLAHRLTAVHRGEAELLPALAEYERRMLTYGFDAVTTSVTMARRFTSNNLPARQGMRTWMRLCAAIPRMKRVSFGQTWADDLPPVPHLV